MNTPSRYLGRVALLAGSACLLLGLAGCGDRMEDLKSYVKDIEGRRGGHIEPLPQIKPPPIFVYADQDERSPFTAQAQGLADKTTLKASKNGISPDPIRNHEYLESFPLDGLKMVGTLSIDGKLYGLIKDSDNILHRVVVGNYMGQNYGKIINIDDASIKLREIVPDGQGGWEERTTIVALSE